jgi:hypothetical protein
MADRDDEFSLRTPSRKATGKSKRPKSGKTKRPSGKTERPRADKPSGKTKRPSGKTERPSGKTKRPSGKAKRPSGANKRPAKGLEDFDGPAPTAKSGSKAVPLLLGALLVLGAGGGMLLLMKEEAPEQIAGQPTVSQPVPEVSTAPVSMGGGPAVGALRPMGKQPVTPKPSTVEELQPVDEGAETPAPTEDELAAMAARSADHAAVARILEEFADLFELNLLANNPHAMAFEERQRREQELLQRLRELGLLAVPALQDMILGLNNRAHQIFLAKALAGMDGDAAREAVSAILGQNKDVALQTTLVRFLPEGEGSLPLLEAAYTSEENPNLRTMLLREVARRGGEDAEATALFRQAAANDGDVNVRAEAVTILGRRGDAADQSLMEDIIRNEQNLQIRQRAIVAYAETGGESSLSYLEELARDPQQGLHVRASAVLAIGRVGGDQAISALDMLGQSDPDQEIRTRATRLAHSLRARRDAADEPTVVDDEPMRVGLPPGQLDRR